MHAGLGSARASWLVGVTVRQWREIEAGTKGLDGDTYERVCDLFGWARSFVTRVSQGKVLHCRAGSGR